jgi:hypothetical protein
MPYSIQKLTIDRYGDVSIMDNWPTSIILVEACKRKTSGFPSLNIFFLTRLVSHVRHPSG